VATPINPAWPNQRMNGVIMVTWGGDETEEAPLTDKPAGAAVYFLIGLLLVIIVIVLAYAGVFPAQ